jgi:hypothetical protein
MDILYISVLRLRSWITSVVLRSDSRMEGPNPATNIPNCDILVLMGGAGGK